MAWPYDMFVGHFDVVSLQMGGHIWVIMGHKYWPPNKNG